MFYQFILLTLLLPFSLIAQASDPILPPSITTPDQQNSKIGELYFHDGYPLPDTVQRIQKALNYLHGVEAFMNSFQGVSTYAIRQGLIESGVQDNEFLIFSQLMDANSLFLTANADTVYYMSVLDLTDHPLVFETPPESLGVLDDMWFRWVSDFGLPGPDRGEGGRYLLVGPNYTGSLPEGGYFICHSRTNHVLVLGRSFLTNNDPEPTVKLIKESIKLYPYVAGSRGTSIASFLQGKVPTLHSNEQPNSPRFVEGTGMVMNTIPPNDFTYYQMLDALVQLEPAEALDPELAGQFEAIGIAKGKKFAPDDSMRSQLQESVIVGNAMSRTLAVGGLPSNRFRYYRDDSAWWNFLFVGGYEFLNPPPMITKEGQIKPFPNSGSRKLHSRTSMFYAATGITPAMCMRLTGIGSQYLIANVDSQGTPFDGAQTYKVVLPKDIPAARFWSLTLYDNQSRSMLQTAQRYPRAGSQTYPSPAAVADRDGSITVYFSPEKPADIPASNWIQTIPGKGWFVILRLYSPLESFFDKSWRVSEIELVGER